MTIPQTPLNLLRVEFESEGAINLKSLFISANVNPLQILAICEYLKIMARSQIMEAQEAIKNDTIKGVDKPKILRTT